MAKILLIIAKEGFQIKEYVDTKEALLNKGHEVITASNEAGEALSHIGTTVKVDIAISDINIDNYDAFYLIGGPGALSYLDNESMYKLIREIHDRNDKLYGAICISPRILIKAGIMKGVNMTGWNGDNELKGLCDAAGSIYIMQRVVRDERVITSEGPMSAYEFGEAIAEQFEL